MQSAKWQKYCKLMDAREGRSALIEYKLWKKCWKSLYVYRKKTRNNGENTQNDYIEKNKNQF